MYCKCTHTSHSSFPSFIFVANARRQTRYIRCFCLLFLFNDGHVGLLQLRPETVAVHRWMMDVLDDWDVQIISLDNISWRWFLSDWESRRNHKKLIVLVIESRPIEWKATFYSSLGYWDLKKNIHECHVCVRACVNWPTCAQMKFSLVNFHNCFLFPSRNAFKNWIPIYFFHHFYCLTE